MLCIYNIFITFVEKNNITMRKYDFGTSAVLVSRVSTSAQTDAPQREDLKRYARELGYTTVTEFGTTESGFLEMDDKQGWN